MALTLTPELEAMVVEDARSLGYQNPEEYLADHLTAIHESEAYLRENREEVAALIEEGLQAAERGELLTPEEAEAEFQTAKSAFYAKASAA